MQGVVEYDEVEFPRMLLSIKPKVKQLHYKGKWDSSIFNKCVAIVGSRKMSSYGRQVIAQIVPQLVNQGYSTVSGFMYGVDIEVHRSTYLSGGRTIAVLGWGIDYEIDIENTNLYHKLLDSHSMFVSEYGGNLVPNRATFPQRNRIVAGLASDVIVIEAARGSGTLITAHLALKQGKKLWAVPGNINSIVSQGSNSLIKEGLAEMFTIDDLNIYPKLDAKNREKVNLSSTESKIVELISSWGGANINEIVRGLDMNMGEVLQIIAGLEMRGVIKEEFGKYIVM